MESAAKVRAGVARSLPEAELIKDKALREKVYDAWAFSLEESGYSSLEEIPFSAVPDSPAAKRGSQADHLRGVAKLAMVMTRELQNLTGSVDVDMDEVIAGGLCHDIGKPFEFGPGKSGNGTDMIPAYNQGFKRPDRPKRNNRQKT